MDETAEMVEGMQLKGVKAVTLYLEPWQKRMLQDYLKHVKLLKPFNKIKLDFTRPVHLNTYRVPFIDPREAVIELYFTDAQKAFLEEETGLKVVDSMRIDKIMIEDNIITFH